MCVFVINDAQQGRYAEVRDVVIIIRKYIDSSILLTKESLLKL